MSDKPYKVGRGRPPFHSRYKPGESGNRGGRPKGARNVSTVVLTEFLREVTTREGGRPVKRPAVAVLTRVMIGKGIQSESKLGLQLLELALAIPESGPPANDDAPQPEDEAILDDFVKRRQRRGESGGD
jgi:hypothetical protein